MPKINEQEYNKLVKEHGGLYAITNNYIREYGLTKFRRLLYDNNPSYEAIAGGLWIDSRMHALEIINKLIKL